MEERALSKVKASAKKVVRVKDVGAATPEMAPKSLWRNQKPHLGWKLDREAFLCKMLHLRLREHLSTSNRDQVLHSPPWLPCSVLFLNSFHCHNVDCYIRGLSSTPVFADKYPNAMCLFTAT